LSFAGKHLIESSILDDVRVMELLIYGENDGGPEDWADPLRAAILARLSTPETEWYLSCVGNYVRSKDPVDYMPLVRQLQADVFDGREPDYTLVHSKRKSGDRGYLRLFIRVPNSYLVRFVTYGWERAIPGDDNPIEGYSMAPGGIERLKEWDRRERDDLLFRDVMDQVQVAFYTVPAEHRSFMFVTNKLTTPEMAQLIDVEGLNRWAWQILQPSAPYPGRPATSTTTDRSAAE
jgi:hypothetical protein